MIEVIDKLFMLTIIHITFLNAILVFLIFFTLREVLPSLSSSFQTPLLLLPTRKVLHPVQFFALELGIAQFRYVSKNLIQERNIQLRAFSTHDDYRKVQNLITQL